MDPFTLLVEVHSYNDIIFVLAEEMQINYNVFYPSDQASMFLGSSLNFALVIDPVMRILIQLTQQIV